MNSTSPQNQPKSLTHCPKCNKPLGAELETCAEKSCPLHELFASKPKPSERKNSDDSFDEEGMIIRINNQEYTISSVVRSQLWGGPAYDQVGPEMPTLAESLDPTEAVGCVGQFFKISWQIISFPFKVIWWVIKWPVRFILEIIFD